MEYNIRFIAQDIVEKYYKDIVDKGGNPYIQHLFRVANKMPNTLLKTAALLHDFIEDFPEKRDVLNVFPKEVILLVEILTRGKEESYMNYIKRIKEDPDAVYVKVADLRDNMDITRLKKVTDEDVARIRKYHKAYKYLIK